MIKTLGLVAIGLSGAAVTANEFDFPVAVQYGALGLAGMVVYYQCQYLKDLTKQHREERKELIESLKNDDSKNRELLTQNIKAYNRLTDILSDRPCLHQDKMLRS